MNLWAYDLGNGLNTSTVPTYTDEELSGNPAFKAQDSQPTGYVDVSGIVNWHYYGPLAGKDYKYIRKEINSRVQTIGWGNLTNDEKEIAVKIFCSAVSQSERAEVYSEAIQRQLSLLHFQAMQESRAMRYARSQAEAFLFLSQAEQDVIITDVIAESVAQKYLSFGREGTESGDPEGLFDYINATTGTKYAVGGLGPLGIRAQSWTPYGRTLDQLCDDMLDILRGLL